MPPMTAHKPETPRAQGAGKMRNKTKDVKDAGKKTQGETQDGDGGGGGPQNRQPISPWKTDPAMGDNEVIDMFANGNVSHGRVDDPKSDTSSMSDVTSTSSKDKPITDSSEAKDRVGALGEHGAKESFLPKLKVDNLANGSTQSLGGGTPRAPSANRGREGSIGGSTEATLLPPLARNGSARGRQGSPRQRTEKGGEKADKDAKKDKDKEDKDDKHSKDKKKKGKKHKKKSDKEKQEQEEAALEEEEPDNPDEIVTEEDIVKNVVMFFGPPRNRPLTLYFHYPNNFLTHRYVLDMVKNQIHAVPYGYVSALQFIDRNVTLGTRTLVNRWLVTLSCPEARDQLLRMGIKLFNKKIYLRRYDEVVHEEFQEFQAWERKVRKFYGTVPPAPDSGSDSSSDSESEARTHKGRKKHAHKK